MPEQPIIETATGEMTSMVVAKEIRLVPNGKMITVNGVETFDMNVRIIPVKEIFLPDGTKTSKILPASSFSLSEIMANEGMETMIAQIRDVAIQAMAGTLVLTPVQ